MSDDFNPAANIPKVVLGDYRYHLPPNFIAQHPTAQRSASRLLVANPNSSTIYHRNFDSLPALLDSDALIVRNTTRVMTARLTLQKSTGGWVEILCLEPSDDSLSPYQALSQCGNSAWRCVVGGKRVSQGSILDSTTFGETRLTAKILTKNGFEAVVQFSWTPDSLSFAEILDLYGSVPLPPYMKRMAELPDKERYQTVYADSNGSAAAPTAGLHFTPEIFSELQTKNIDVVDVALHVGLGTFQPLKKETLDEFDMHKEKIAVKREALEAIMDGIRKKKKILCVGTTSLRTVESLYWLGLSLERRPFPESSGVLVSQWEAYNRCGNISPLQALENIADYMDKEKQEEIVGSTQILIVPGYSVKICDILLTNFHQPESTLILLVAAFVGKFWRDIYESALNNNYRFLSYGDASLIYRNNLQQ